MPRPPAVCSWRSRPPTRRRWCLPCATVAIPARRCAVNSSTRDDPVSSVAESTRDDRIRLCHWTIPTGTQSAPGAVRDRPRAVRPPGGGGDQSGSGCPPRRGELGAPSYRRVEPVHVLRTGPPAGRRPGRPDTGGQGDDRAVRPDPASVLAAVCTAVGTPLRARLQRLGTR